LAPIDHKLGRSNGIMREFSDGTVEYRRNLSAQFRIRIADVKGFSRTKGPIWADGAVSKVCLGNNFLESAVPYL
jgi:hypothetical protein